MMTTDSESEFWRRTASRVAVICQAFYLLACCTSDDSIAGEKNNSPTTYYVQVERAEVYAGPDKHYYPTGYLSRGSSVDVFVKLESGWCGVRPPQGSFSWLPASQGYLLPGGKLVEVTDESAVSWIGTELGTAKQYRWQVQLQRGEQLTVVGESTIRHDGESPALWYKIAPPDGEFRWIRSEAISQTPPATPELKLTTKSEPASSGDQTKGEEGQVERASYETSASSVASSASPDSPPRTRGRSQRTPPTARTKSHDPWAGYHAFDFSAGALSFLGLIPRPGQSQSPTTPNPGHVDDDPSTMIAKHGWQDPRDLQARRIANRSNGASSRATRDFESSLSAPSDVSIIAADSGSAVRPEAATNQDRVIPALATQPAWVRTAMPEPATTDSATFSNGAGSPWYGIQQANAESLAPTRDGPLLELTAKSLSDIHLAVSEIVAQPMTLWNLTALENQTRYLVEHGATAIERGEARLLLERIAGFQAIAEKNAALAGAPSPSSVPNMQVTPFQLASANVTSQQASGQSSWLSYNNRSDVTDNRGSMPSLPYDATGWLVPVHLAEENRPEMYALTNDSGKVIVYVTPIAGLNLGRFLNQPVGIYGLRGYLPRLKTNHIEAQRVVRLK